MNYDKLIVLLSRLLGQYKKKQEQYRFYCPFCNHYKRKLYVNVVSQKWHCWVCGKSGLKLGSLIRKVSKNSNDIQQYNNLRKQNKISTSSFVYKNINKESDLQLPDEFVSLLYKKQSIIIQRAKIYLQNRGITDEHIHLFNIGFCPSGKYKDRIIIPSYDKQFKLNYFIARSIIADSKMKYLNPDKTKNIIPLQSTINWNLPVILVQGMFDAITIKYNAIPLLGKSIQANNSNLLTTLLRRNSKVIVFLDADARSDMFKICDVLYNNGIMNVYYVDLEKSQNKDANQMGIYNAWNLIQSAKKYEPNTTLSDSIKSKIGKLNGKKNTTHFRLAHSII